ncbi:MAG TPA: hypothetical protein DHV36_12370 [Desulfobacteraceae bacterium]|nr:hypothetical protein [Desulfobacteraceae bacterium]|tara:strand:+ start:4833 stop:5918 length:1086 start_codon:yes stop_codon:yes gene_type:complete
MTSGDKYKNLLILYRYIEHQYQLSAYTDETLKSIQKTIDIAREQLFDEISFRDMRMPKGREDMVLEELNNLTLGIQTNLIKNIREAAVVAGEYSYREYDNILSFDGKLSETVGYNFTAISPDQLRSMAVSTPVGGKLLSSWVKNTFDLRIIDEIQVAIMADNFKGLGTQKIIRHMASAFDMIQTDAETLVRTYIADMNNTAAKAVYDANADIIKYEVWNSTLEVAVSGRGTCLRCAGMDGRRFRLGDAHIRPPLHPRCRCFCVPETASYRDLGLDIDDLKRSIRPYTERADKRKIIKAGQIDGDFEAFFNSRGAQYQKDLLGPNRFRLLQGGKISFSDLVDKHGDIRLLKKDRTGKFVGLR